MIYKEYMDVNLAVNKCALLEIIPSRMYMSEGVFGVPLILDEIW